MPDDSISIDTASSVDELVDGARRGDAAAWDALVLRYSPLVVAVTRTYRLPQRDAEDVGQVVWLRLTEYLDRIRDSRALPKWIMTTARHECLRIIRQMRLTIPMDPLTAATVHAQPSAAAADAELLRAEERQALHDGLAELPVAQRQFLLLLVADPPITYREISDILGIPVGSIGPTRARCLRRLRATSAMRQFLGRSAAP